MPVPSRIAVGQHPCVTTRFHQRNDEFSLFFRAVRTHRCDNIWQGVLIQPPDRGEAFHDDEIVNRLLESKAVVEKQRLSEFKELSVSFSFTRKLVSRVVLCDQAVVHDTAGIADKRASHVI